MEETALKSVLWFENSRMELQIPPLWRGSGLPRTSALEVVIFIYFVTLASWHSGATPGILNATAVSTQQSHRV